MNVIDRALSTIDNLFHASRVFGILTKYIIVHCPGDNELYIAGGDGHGKCLYKWCYEDATFEDMSSMTLNRRQYVHFISIAIT